MSTKYAGKNGILQTPSLTAIAGIKSWTLDQTADALETTSFDDAGVAAYIGGVTRWSGSFEGYKTGTALVIDGSATTITCVEDTGLVGQTWSGACILTGVHAANSFDGLVTYAYDFQGTGALTEPIA